MAWALLRDVSQLPTLVADLVSDGAHPVVVVPATVEARDGRALSRLDGNLSMGTIF